VNQISIGWPAACSGNAACTSRAKFLALLALVVGMQTAGRLLPAEWAMREVDFEVLLHLVERLSDQQRTALGRALASASGEPEAVRLLEQAFAAAPRCPHCTMTVLQRWGHASGLRRYRCTTCQKTFNALTGTSLARLRKRACWLRYGEALAAGMSLTKAAVHCGVHLTTSFRWRHRFLRAPAAAREALAGVVEADETFFRRSHKGSRRWRCGDAPPGRGPHRRGERAGKRGLSAEQVPALIARDRAGHTADAVLPDLGAEAIKAVLAPVVAGDAVLCSDGAKAYAAFAAGHGLHHEPVNLAAGIRVRDGAFHIQNVNAYHGRLKGWMGRFNGVATRYLPNYLGWRRTLERTPDPSASRTWLLAAARPIPTTNAN
jgi:transposase-like protein